MVFKGERFIKESILDIKTHYKPTETFQYTHFTSCHPPGVKRGFIKGEAIRLVRTNSSKTTFEECLANFKRHLEARRYPKKYLITWNFRDTLISRFWGSHISGQLNFAILRKFCILTHFNFAFLSETLFLRQFYSTCPWIWSNLINNVQININVTDYVTTVETESSSDEEEQNIITE